MSTRIYKTTVVYDARSGERSEYLVNAVSSKQAQLHIAKRFINARVASASDVATLMGQGKKVEDATAPPKETKPEQRAIDATAPTDPHFSEIDSSLESGDAS